MSICDFFYPITSTNVFKSGTSKSGWPKLPAVSPQILFSGVCDLPKLLISPLMRPVQCRDIYSQQRAAVFPVLFPLLLGRFLSLRVDCLYDRTCSAIINQFNSTFKCFALSANKSSSMLEITASLYLCLSAAKAATLSGNGCQFLIHSLKHLSSVSVGSNLNILPNYCTISCNNFLYLIELYSDFSNSDSNSANSSKVASSLKSLSRLDSNRL